MRALIAASLLAFAPTVSFADITIRFIANEGVHISDGETGILIDALTWNSYDGMYALPSDAARAAMINGDAPYVDVAALLFTHIHGDHSDPAGAVAFLNAQADVSVAASSQITDAMMAAEAGLEDTAVSRVSPVELSAAHPGPWSSPEHDFIEGAWVFHRQGVDNITWHVRLGGLSILHLGDTQPQMADFSVWDETEFDVILYPYWFAQMDEGVAFLNSRPDARAIAFHLPAAATPLTIRAGIGEREYLFGEGSEIVIETND